MEGNHSPFDMLMFQYMKAKEIGDPDLRYYRSQLSISKSLVDRLGLDCELNGHSGCVNCLEWNQDGSILASGSDDFSIMLWDPFKRKRILDFHTNHHGNIFSVKFMPSSNSGLVASGAGDGHVKIHAIDHPIDENTQPSFQCKCHAGRVKRLATAPDIPYLLWSGAEDGTVMQFDLRAPHNCINGPSQILINLLSHAGTHSEVKSIAVNPLRTEQLAVGANDPFVRLYDRRMIKITSLKYESERPPTSWDRHSFLATNARSDECRQAIPLGGVQYFAPAHLPRKLEDYRRRYRSLASTYVTFDPTGRYLLANLGGEQIYLYDCSTPNAPASTAEVAQLCSEGCRSDSSSAALTPAAEKLKLQANTAFQQCQFNTAIGLYSKALCRAPKSAVLFSNRAAALMKRNWDGDTYAAMRDCCSAIKLDAGKVKPFHRLVRCLQDLGWTESANDAMNGLKNAFPDHSSSATFKNLEKEIQTSLALAQQATGSRQSSLADTINPPSEQQELINVSVADAMYSVQENHWRSNYWDYNSRFCGHCNTTTDIKEANFFGDDGQYIVAGSDDGCFFIWDRRTGIVEKVLRGDSSIVNCLQPHPFTCLLATSGIDSAVRLWSPLPQNGVVNDRAVIDAESASVANQRRMNTDPFEMIVTNLGAETGSNFPNDPIRFLSRQESQEGLMNDTNGAPIQCRPS